MPQTALIETSVSTHATQQAQRRGINNAAIDLILTRNDRSGKLPERARATWISRRARERLVRDGHPPSLVDRTRGVRLIIRDDVVMTVEHSLARRKWA